MSLYRSTANVSATLIFYAVTNTPRLAGLSPLKSAILE